MKIAIGCDEAAYALKEEIRGYLLGQTDVPVEVEDFGVHSTDPVDYPDIAVQVAEAVAEHRADEMRNHAFPTLDADRRGRPGERG